MKYNSQIVILLLIILLTFQTITAAENEYGIVKAWCNNEPATVEDINLKVGESIVIKVEVSSKIDGFIDLKLKEPGVTKAFDVISGPSKIGEWITENNVDSDWTKVYTWTIAPNNKWTNGRAPVNILVNFNKEINDDQSIQFTIANPYILNEQYSGPTPTTTAPSSTDQPPSQGSPGFGVVGTLMGIMLAVGFRFGKN
jgi:sarcinarray family protein